MIKKYTQRLLVSLAAILLVSTPAFAQQSVLSDAHVAQIKANCQQARAVLGQINTNDAPVYVNKNQIYYSISDKLMSRLNSRLTLNSYDASDLVKTASDYVTALQEFRNNYRAYETKISKAIHTDCISVPVEFYDAVAAARDARTAVNESTVKLKGLIMQYGNQVHEFENSALLDRKAN